MLAALLAGCSGGSDPAAGPVPIVVAATYVGAGSTPAAGDVLLLRLSADATLRSDALLDDTDVGLSNGSLGAVTFVPLLDQPRVVRVVLGDGASFEPGVTTITFSDENDAVLGVTGQPGRPDTPRIIERGDGDVPVITELTIEGIPGQLNGRGSAGGRLQVARTGFRIHVTASDASSAIDPARTVVSVDVVVAAGGGVRTAGEDLASFLVAGTDGDRIELLVPASVSFPPGDLTLTVAVADETGMVAAPAAFTFRTVEATAALRPLENGQLWFLDTSRDVESYTVTTNPLQSSITEVGVTAGSNGRSDLEDLMLVVGLLHTTPLPATSGGLDSNATVLATLRTRVLAELATLFDGVDVDFTFDAPGTFPPGRVVVAYEELGFSQICIAGAATEDGVAGTLGAALLDPRNQSQEDDCLLDFQGIRLGVFLHTAVRFGSKSGATSAWRSIFDDFTPAIGGTPIGADAQDGARLAGTLADARAVDISTALRAFARVTAVITAHECGHSMGLVTNGPMPSGLYGNDPVNFPLSRGLDPSAASGHIQNQALFPAGSQNVMSPAIDFESSLSPNTAFNPLNLAYLREHALYDQ